MKEKIKTKIAQVRDIAFIEGFLISFDDKISADVTNLIQDRFEYLYGTIDKEVDEILETKK
jgi:hypothetical protein